MDTPPSPTPEDEPQRTARQLRLVLSLVILTGAALLALALGALLTLVRVAGDVDTDAVPQRAQPSAAPPTMADAERVRSPLDIVMAYVQASARAGREGQAAPLAPFLEPNGPAWHDVQRSFAARQARGELHDPTLTRWGVVSTLEDGATATVVLIEQWDDTTLVAGQVVASLRGQLTRQTYTLQRGDRGWRIVAIATELLMD